MSVRAHAPDCAKTLSLKQDEAMLGVQPASTSGVRCTCGAEYEPGAASAEASKAHLRVARGFGASICRMSDAMAYACLLIAAGRISAAHEVLSRVLDQEPEELAL